MTPLRKRMLEDMRIRNLSVNTQLSYQQQISAFAGARLAATPDRGT